MTTVTVAEQLIGGTDPGADAEGAATLAAFMFAPGRGYRRDEVDDWRRRALNTVTHLEAEREALLLQVGDLRRRLDAELGPTGLSRGLAWLALEVRGMLAGRPAERAWAGQELAAIVSAEADELAAELAAAFPERMETLMRGAEVAAHPASWLVQAIFGEERP